ncbi:MAG: hypothetical protein AAF630_09005 [Cyanobacteria bacterium P01_C01_bin.38]
MISKILLKFTDNFGEYHRDISALLLTPEKHLWLVSDEIYSGSQFGEIHNFWFWEQGTAESAVLGVSPMSNFPREGIGKSLDVPHLFEKGYKPGFSGLQLTTNH